MVLWHRPSIEAFSDDTDTPATPGSRWRLRERTVMRSILLITLALALLGSCAVDLARTGAHTREGSGTATGYPLGMHDGAADAVRATRSAADSDQGSMGRARANGGGGANGTDGTDGADGANGRSQVGRDGGVSVSGNSGGAANGSATDGGRADGGSGNGSTSGRGGSANGGTGGRGG